MSGDASPAARRPVVVVQPVHQHAYETAVAADKARLLRCFITGLYCTSRRAANLDSRGWLPHSLERAVSDKLRARWHPGLDSRRVLTITRHQALAVGVRIGLARLPLMGGWDLDLSNWANDRFDAAVARWLRRAGHRGLVHGFEGTSGRTLEAARQQGAVAVLDVPSAHEYHLDAIEAEGGTVDRRRTVQVKAERALADYLLAPSEYVIRCLVEHGVERSRIVHLPYGVDPSRFAPSPSGASGRPFRAVFVGRIELGKGVRYLLEAWRRLALPDAELLLVGAPDRAGQGLLAEYEGTYRWIGAVPRREVHRWFAAADLLAFPTLSEGFGLVYLEAMATGLPVVTTPNGASVVRNGVDGLVVPPRDVDALCDAIMLLYQRPDLRKEMGANGRRLVEVAYTWEHYGRRLTDFYRTALSDESIGAPT